jgi:hypothetical protein
MLHNYKPYENTLKIFYYFYMDKSKLIGNLYIVTSNYIIEDYIKEKKDKDFQTYYISVYDNNK